MNYQVKCTYGTELEEKYKTQAVSHEMNNIYHPDLTDTQHNN